MIRSVAAKYRKLEAGSTRNWPYQTISFDTGPSRRFRNKVSADMPSLNPELDRRGSLNRGDLGTICGLGGAPVSEDAVASRP